METVQYQLKSKSGETVKVSVEDAKKAESLVTLVLENPTGLVEALSEHPYLSNWGIWARASSLAMAQPGTPESLKLQDDVYLRVCIYGNEQKMSGSERQEAMELYRALVQMVEDLESQ